MGDLSWRLIMPALFNLHLDYMLPERFVLFGVDLKEFDDTRLAEHYLQGISNFSRRGNPSEAEWQGFSHMLRYVRADLSGQDEFNRLADLLNDQEKLWRPGGTDLLHGHPS